MTRRWRIWRMARLELTELTRAGTYRGAAALFAVAALVGLAAGALHYQRIATTADEAILREAARWRSQPPRDPHSASHFGQTAFHRRALLSAIDSGVDPFVGVSVFLEAHKRNFPRYPWSADTARWSGLGHYTIATALRVLMPLFLILLAHGSIVGERERGTLAMTVATGASPRTIVAGKLVGLGLALAVISVPLCVAGAVTLGLITAAPDGTDWVARAVGLVMAYLTYAFVFIAVALAVSARAGTTATARATLFAFWAVSALVAPRAIPDLALWAHPVPSSMELEKAIQEDPDRYPGVKGREEFRRAVLAEHGVSSVDELPVNFDGLWALESEEHSTRIMDKHYSTIDRAHAGSARFIALGSIVSPTLAVDGVSMALAGSDLGHYTRFRLEAEAHRRLMVRLLNEDLARHPKARDVGYRAGPALWVTIPTFDHQHPDVLWAVREGAAAVAALAAWLLLGVGLVVLTARRLARAPIP